MNTRLRPLLDTLACAAATPVSVLAHVAVYLGWWAVAPDSPALLIALSLEAIVIGLIIVDKQNQDAVRDREWQQNGLRELLEAVPGARPEVVEERT